MMPVTLLAHQNLPTNLRVNKLIHTCIKTTIIGAAIYVRGTMSFGVLKEWKEEN